MHLKVVREQAVSEGGGLTFSRGLLLVLQQSLRETKEGDLFAVTVADPMSVGEVERWARLTGHALILSEPSPDGHRVVLRNGPAEPAEKARPVGSRVWFYTNFDCNLACDYCCVRSSPRAPREALGADMVRAIALELQARGGVEDVFLTGGEPFLLPDIAELALHATELAPTTILTNGMLFRGSRRRELERLSRQKVTLQISLDSPDAGLHDLHRGAGSFARALEGIRIARDLGFRVRLAATVSSAEEEQRFAAFLDDTRVATEDRVIRRVALQGFAQDGIPLTMGDLMPELTFTARGVYYHPVTAVSDAFLITRDLLPVSAAIRAVEEVYARESAYGNQLASIFHCA